MRENETPIDRLRSYVATVELEVVFGFDAEPDEEHFQAREALSGCTRWKIHAGNDMDIEIVDARLTHVEEE